MRPYVALALGVALAARSPAAQTSGTQTSGTQTSGTQTSGTQTSGTPTDAPRWTGFRGDDAGRAPSVELAPETVRADARWSVELPGPGHSSPVVSGQRVFVTCCSADGKARLLLALDLATGAVLGRHAVPFEPYPVHAFNGFVSATPVVDGERLFLAFVSAGRCIAAAFDHELQPLWTKDLGPHSAEHGWGGSPALVGETLVVANDNDSEASFVVGLEPATGDERWRRPRRSVRAAYATPVAHVGPLGEQQVLLGSTAHGVTCLDARTGALAWEVDGLFEQRVVATPVVVGGVVVLLGGQGGGGTDCAAIALPGQEDAGQVRYRLRRSLPYVPTPVAAGELLFLFADAGVVSCVEGASGALVWRERIDGEFFGSPIIAGERLIALTKSGDLVVLAARREFARLGDIELGETSYATPAVAGGLLLLRTERHLYAFAAARPRVSEDPGGGR